MPIIEVEVVGAEAAAARLARAPTTLRQALADAMRRQIFRIQAAVVTEKLSGDPLHRRTGNLASSINTRLDDDGEEITGRVGTKVRYGRVHELGGTFTIPSHQRRVTTVYGRAVAEHEITVREHTATFPQRSFLRSTLNELRQSVIEALRRAVTQGTEKV